MPFNLKWLYGNKQYSAGLISFYNIYKVSKSRDLYLGTPIQWLYAYSDVRNIKPDVSDETGALLVYSSFITYKKF